MKKAITLIILSLLLIIPLNLASASEAPDYLIKGQSISDLWIASFPDENGLKKEVLMVPLRDVAEVLGLTVTWYPESKIATIKPVKNEHLKNLSKMPAKNCMYFSTTIIFKDDSCEIGLTDYFSSASYQMPGKAKAVIRGEKMYVPGIVFTDFLGQK
ncbi:MAG: stalk domain-containing protein [Bacillota bacterium]